MTKCVCCVFVSPELKHVQCVMRDNVAVVRLNSPDNKVHVGVVTAVELRH